MNENLIEMTDVIKSRTIIVFMSRKILLIVQIPMPKGSLHWLGGYTAQVFLKIRKVKTNPN